jgi:hypothetical protein
MELHVNRGMSSDFSDGLAAPNKQVNRLWLLGLLVESGDRFLVRNVGRLLPDWMYAHHMPHDDGRMTEMCYGNNVGRGGEEF